MAAVIDRSQLAQVALTEAEYRAIVRAIGRDPNDLELGMFGALWSEHCSYKTSKALLRQLPTEGPHVLQGPGENAGAVDIGDGLAVVFKIESHNHPSAIEPYQGAATGVGAAAGTWGAISACGWTEFLYSGADCSFCLLTLKIRGAF